MLMIEKYIETENMWALVRQQDAKQQGTGVTGNVLELMVVIVVQLCDDTKAAELYILNEWIMCL